MRNTRGWGLLEGVLARRRARRIASLLGSMAGKSILDIGCGGHLYLLRYTDARLVMGIRDNAEVTLSRFRPCTLDAITMAATLEHFAPDALPSLLRRLYGLLRRGGRLIITTPPAWTVGLLQTMARHRLVSPVEIADHKGQYAPAAVWQMLRDAGFSGAAIDWSYYDLWTNSWFMATKEEVRYE